MAHAVAPRRTRATRARYRARRGG